MKNSTLRLRRPSRMKSYLSSEVLWFLVCCILSLPYFTIAACLSG